MLAYLQKSKGSEGFHQIIDFLNTSHIKYALTKNPTIYVSLIHQFRETASVSTSKNGDMEITATIDGRIKIITEASIRRHLKLEDSDGIPTSPNAKNFKQLALLGPKKTAWEQFSSNIATAIICLATNRTFNFSKMIFDGMMKNLDNKTDIGVAYTKLIMRMKKLEKIVKQSKARRKTKIVVSDDEEVLEDPSKQGRIIAEIDQNPSISLVQDEGTSWIQEDAETKGRTSADTKILLELEEPTEPVEDPGSGEKGEKEISTVEVLVSTASAIPEVSTAIPERKVYIRRSVEKRKDKGKAIMKDDESVQKKTKKQLEQERLGHEEAIRLQEQINEEERQRIARDAEIAKQLQEEIDIARQEQEKYDLAQVLEFKRSWIKGKKIPGFDLQQKQPAEEEKLKKNDDSSKPSGGSRKKILARKRASEKQSEEGAKRQKMEDNTEKEELKAYLDIVPGEEFAMDVESLSTKADGSSKNYKIFSKMIDDFDRQDVIDLHRLVKERYVTTSPEGYDLMMWGDLKTLFEPDEEDEVWRNQHGYNLISWRLIDSCGIHILLMDNGIAIHMMVEKKYPLIQEMLSKMLNKRLEIDHESEMAFELLRFTRSQLQNDSQGESNEDVDEEEAEAFNFLARNFRKFFRKANRFARDNRFGNGANKFGKGRGNSFGNRGGESSKPKGACYNCGIEGHFASECRKSKENKAFIGGS
ncbi:retrovirus-related pol polyprotein from transposon TNT 1-94 [Tanacetum coccineum]